MSSDEKRASSKDRKHRKRSETPPRRERDHRRPRDDRDSRRRRRSRSPRDDRRPHRNDRRGDKPIIPQRPKLFKRPTDESAGPSDANNWSTRIAAVASDDGQRSKFEKLLGMHKKQPNSESDPSKPVLKSVDETEVKSMRNELSKMESALDTQYTYARAFTHSFRGRGL